VSVNQGWPNTANSKILVRNIYVVGEEYQTSDNMEGEVSKTGYLGLQL
jgi:hypothetical protein